MSLTAPGLMGCRVATIEKSAKKKLESLSQDPHRLPMSGRREVVGKS